MITPKYDMRTPLPLSVCRLPKPDEQLISLSGSPVVTADPKPSGVTTLKKAHRAPKGVDTNVSVPIKLAKGNTLVLPMAEAIGEGDGGLQLDEAARKKLELLNANISKLLQQNVDSQ